jgi:hypothetical protein
VQLVEALLDDFAEMTSLAGINDDFTRLRHSKECSSFEAESAKMRNARHGMPEKDGRRIS